MSQYQDEELNRPSKSVEEMEHEFPSGKLNNRTTDLVPLLPESFTGTMENVVLHLELLSNGIFRNLFENGKQPKRQLIHVQLVLAYTCPHLFCILKKSAKLKLLHQHFETA